MAKHAYIVKVPKPDPKSYNPDRPITSLVQNQLFHLRVTELSLPEHHRSGMDLYSITTEAKAAKYIAHLTGKLHLAGGKQQRAKEESKSTEASSGKKERKAEARGQN